jgi:rhodanese-related sulfurtransferase
LLVMFGMFAGVLGTGLAFGSISNFYASTARGAITLPQLLGVPYGAVVFGVVAMALIAFWWIRRFEAPASTVVSARAPRIRALAVAAALFGALAVFAGSPYRAAHATVDVQRLASAVAHEEDHVTAIELAEWIRGRKAGLRIVDLRSAGEFETYHVPRAECIALESLATAPFRTTDTIVLISGGGAHAAQAWVLLQALGYKQVYFLRGGLQEWIDDVMNPTILATAPPRAMAEFKRVGEISRYFGGVPRIVEKLEPRPVNAEGATEGDGSSSSTSDAAVAIRRRGC